MKVEENIKLINYFDVYGVLLSKGQQEIMRSYLCDNLTVSEIAENLSVSRQSVMDSIKKAEKKLYDMEEKLSFLSKMEALSNENLKLRREIELLKSK